MTQHPGRARSLLISLALLLFLSPACLAWEPPPVKSPPFKPLEYYLASIPQYPYDDTAEHQAELGLVLEAREKADEKTIARCTSEFDFQAGTFDKHFQAVVGPWFTAEKLPVAMAFVNRTAELAQPICDNLKDVYKRARPFVCDARIHQLPQRVGPNTSFPSGHAFRSYFFALLIAELVPDQKEAIMRKGMEIGWDRIVAGFHHPSDIFAGRTLAAMAFRDLKEDPGFQKDLEAAKKEVAAVSPQKQ